MKNKKKNSQIDPKLPEPNGTESHNFDILRLVRISSSFKNNRFYPGPNMQAPNNYKAAMILPDGYRAACHLHKEIMLFKTLEEAAKHMKDIHMVWKG